MNQTQEWIEPDGLGGFASGTAATVRTRRYHGLLLSALTPPTGRTMLVAGLDAWVDGGFGRVHLLSHRFVPGIVHPTITIARFGRDPWPTWSYALPDGSRVTLEVFVVPGRPRTWVRWQAAATAGPLLLHVRPLLASRDYHGLQREDAAARMSTERSGNQLQWRLHANADAITCRSTGRWREEPVWFRQFEYTAEQERGLDAVEDLASPGVLQFSLDAQPAIAVFGANASLQELDGSDLVPAAHDAGERERRRRAGLGDRLAQAADAYFVQRGTGLTLVAGYPWFTDWGRDTFIAMRGLCLATGRLADARDILLAWAETVDGGMLPNRFPDAGDAPEYNSVDAALWFVVVCRELLDRPAAGDVLTSHDRRDLEAAIMAVLRGYAAGTRHGIRMDADGLLQAGVPGQQLTWMDARVDGHEITPRIGKPVEIQALWINALAAGAALSGRWSRWLTRAREAFDQRFTLAGAAWLPDVVDVDHVAGTRDVTFRPNQILAAGGLPVPVVTGRRARAIVDLVESRLWTPLGLRSLAPGEPGYAPRYEGGPSARDAVYHQGTVWPWLVGPFVDAWVRVRGGGAAVQCEARERFLGPLMAHLDESGLGHVSEIADAEAPHHPRGCPFQAWSVGELLRLDRQLAQARTHTAAASPPGVR